VRTGVGQVTGHLVGSLAARADVEVVAYAVSRSGRRLLDGLLPAGVRAGTSPIPARAAVAAWRHVPYPRLESWTGPVDVLHATNYVAPPTRSPAVVTVHDLTFVRHPELCEPWARRAFAPLVSRAVRRGATLHVVSDFVRDEVLEIYGVPPHQVVRVYLGLAATGGGDALAGRRLTGADRYVLALGAIEPRKNLPRLVAAFDRVAGRDPGLRLVVAGPDGWGFEAFTDAVAAAQHRDRIVRLGYVEDAQRRDLLAGATALAYPSLYEGFGHPPLEAMGAGVPVVAARAGALPEVLGDAAVLTDPLDVDGLADAIEQVVSDEDLRTELVDRGLARVDRYSWSRAADELVALYRTLAERAS
jgi:glycosyltransferase involved in cell wall biosynthesis